MPQNEIMLSLLLRQKDYFRQSDYNSHASTDKYLANLADFHLLDSTALTYIAQHHKPTVCSLDTQPLKSPL